MSRAFALRFCDSDSEQTACTATRQAPRAVSRAAKHQLGYLETQKVHAETRAFVFREPQMHPRICPSSLSRPWTSFSRRTNKPRDDNTAGWRAWTRVEAARSAQKQHLVLLHEIPRPAPQLDACVRPSSPLPSRTYASFLRESLEMLPSLGLIITNCEALKLRSLPFTHPIYVASRYFQ